MEAKEFRIGNIISIKKHMDYFVVHEFTNHLVKVVGILEGAHFQAEISECVPVTVTEEWLKKLGFENEGGLFWKDELYWENGTGGFVGQRRFDTEVYADCEFIHQIQNLYFSLYGKELTLIE